MPIAALAAALVTLSQGSPSEPANPAPAPLAERALVERRPLGLADVLNTPDARDATARVAYAEAGNQGESGLAGVVYTIINRLMDGRWGSTVEAVVDAPHQFEPVMRAGGTWRRLRPVSAVQEATVHTIVSLALQGRLPDLTGGAKYFQNRQVVAARAAAGTVSPSLVGFGGATPVVQIGDHTFYAAVAKSSDASWRRRRPPRGARGAAGGAIFLGENRAQEQGTDPMTPQADAAPIAALP